MNLIEKFNLLSKKIEEANNILVVGHLRPDGDAISSCCAILEIAKMFKKEARAFCSGNLPNYLQFLPNFNKISFSFLNNSLADFDLMIVVDCGSLSRTNLSSEIKKSRIVKKPFIVEIDHHPAMDSYADLEIRQPLSASTTELIYEFFQSLNFSLNKNIAECLLTGIITDTGNLFYPNVSAKTLKISSDLMSSGANLSKITKHIASSQNMSRFKLWGLAMDRLEVNLKYDLAYSVLTLEDLKKISDDSEEISEILSSIAGFLSNLADVKFTLLLHETAPNMIKGHLRSSSPNIDISKLAYLLGGGGHPQASGFSLAGKIEKVNSNWTVL
jgi:bifunctional oligoribonuclease and PAP phosphatase NrnA